MLTNQHRAQWGSAGVRAGAPDYNAAEPETALADALANMMHAAQARGVDFRACLTSAAAHFEAECVQS